MAEETYSTQAARKQRKKEEAKDKNAPFQEVMPPSGQRQIAHPAMKSTVGEPTDEDRVQSLATRMRPMGSNLVLNYNKLFAFMEPKVNKHT